MQLKKFILIVLLAFSPFLRGAEFDKVVIWGHKFGTHTHSYIHNGFYIAFNHLGYETYWLDNSDDVSEFDFSNTLFLTEGQVDNNIPLRNDCLYMLHNPSNPEKYINNIPAKNRIYFQVYTDDVLNKPNCVMIDKFVYYNLPSQCLYMPWATDLLPDEIETIKQQVCKSPTQNYVCWVGTIGVGLFGNKEQIDPFIQASEENGFEFIHTYRVSVEDNIKLISESYMAPTIVGKWQQEKGYIPCRIFKNISYGKMGVTNSRNVYEIFDRKIVYNPDSYQLFYDAQERMKDLTVDEIYELMDIVKTKHTYINRIQTLLFLMDLVQSQR